MSKPKVYSIALLFAGLLCPIAIVQADHIEAPSYRNMETTESRTVTTSPLSGMLIYRIEYKGHLAVAYRICLEQEEPFPFAIADFARDILYLDRNRDGHIDERVAPANLEKRSLTEDLPSCALKPGAP
ncbi:MAG TPA: hypothetical protein VGJ57_01475 [Nitrospirales bacterium]|jgi:hypothetical protein